MRSRSNSGVRLDYYYRIVHRTILQHQHPVTGLLPASSSNDHAWVRDNIYSILAVWGLAMAYKKNADLDEDRAKTYELEQSCVKLMRGLLTCMIQQKEKVEMFKHTQAPLDALHAKYSSTTGQIVVRDNEWGHLQIDATSLFLLVLAQMTASGLQIIFNLDEVSFIQNLVFYIESAYCVPDYGIWERGDKTNHGLPELNASSIGMAKAALEAMNELDLFGARGGPTSVIHVLADEAQKCQAVLQSMLPRESNSKEVDSSLMAVISFPAFAVDDPLLIKTTRHTIQSKLEGPYGCKRFLRDGYKTAKEALSLWDGFKTTNEDPTRLYYEPWELKVFEKIECEWPLFFCYFILDHCFQGKENAIKEYSDRLEKLLVTTEDGLRLVPEIYSVPGDKVEEEYKKPGSQQREVAGKLPFKWAQSLYIVGRLLQDNFLACGELDPLNRRLGSEKKPDVVVQVVVLAEDSSIQAKLSALDIHVQTIAEVAPIEVQPARVLSKLYAHLGRNQKLGLSGRQSRDVGILSTSKLYSLQDRIFAFTPQYFDNEESYLSNDVDLGVYFFGVALDYVASTWKDLGRPMVVLRMRSNYTDEDGKIPPSMISTLKKLNSGYINGTRVSLGKMQEFLNTSCITSLNFLNDTEAGFPDSLKSDVKEYLEKQMRGTLSWRRSDLVRMSNRFPFRLGDQNYPQLRFSQRTSRDRDDPVRRKISGMLRGTIRKSRSLFVDDDREAPPIVSRRSSVATSPTSDIGMPILEVSVPPTPTRVTPPLSSHSRSRSRSPSPEKDSDLWESMVRHRVASDAVYENVDLEELMMQLREAENLEEQGDILHYLVVQFGLNHETGSVIEGQAVTVKDLLKDLYERACHIKHWALVRHTAGMLGKRVEDLAKAVTDLLVRQKQVTVGLPPHNEITITAPLPSSELRVLIHQAYGADESTAMLTQELLVYLAMFIRTEPSLFNEMLRLRVGLIIQVMATELARTIKCAADVASEHLLNLSPFEMKNLLHHIMSGKEFNIGSVLRKREGIFNARSGTFFISSRSTKLSKGGLHAEKKSTIGSFLGPAAAEGKNEEPDERHGQWLRRRRLDGALNRVPRNFYPQIWKILGKCKGINIEGKVIPHSLTQEMTAGELKFALEVETVLNTIPQPEYRQLVVEALMVLSLVREYHNTDYLGDIVSAQDIVHVANNIFLSDQKQQDGDATTCCAREKREPGVGGGLACGGAAYICQHFYDSAPSGSYGTMSYMIRAATATLNCFPQDGELDCAVS
ncbi:probable phosphorylase b kinase regulatory subunit alpha isoform X10 [Portunus trituberculatus]|uniref:probable phosphorylase b kinase regulatory subunit alpha isoform X10 n=1 Tax=Portunus trituberculatus TaxID=210409 RepID=UPI001E1CEA07|nr:probable phosphorylase b kinase regulatory subunit alpha isoform X10 [Portunus trituberculatus]